MTEQRSSTLQQFSPGTIEVMPRAIATIALHAATETPGVVGMARPAVSDTHATLLGARATRQGVEVQIHGERVVVDVYVVLAYGARISEIAQQVQSNVQHALERALNTSVISVGVRVQGVEIPKSGR